MAVIAKRHKTQVKEGGEQLFKPISLRHLKPGEYEAIVKSERERVAALNKFIELLPDDHPSRAKKGDEHLFKPIKIKQLEPGEYLEITRREFSKHKR